MLNNRGWGSKEVLMIISVMAVAVMVTMFIYNKNFKDLFEGDSDEKSVPETAYEYEKAEITLKNAAKKYYVDNFSEEKVGEIPSMTVASNTLKNKNYLGSLEANDRECTGYVTIKNNNSKISYNAYVKCGNYKTEGYTLGLDN